jgi:transposase
MDFMALRELADILDIPAVKVTGYRKEQGLVEVCVDLEKNSATCPGCGVRSSRKHSQKPIRVRDLPCFGRQVYLLLPRRRFKCRHCGKPFMEHLAFVEFGTSFTKRYEQYIYEQCRERSFTAVENQEGISDTVIAKIYDSHAATCVQPRGRPKKIRVLGIDEISMRKGHRDFVCVITDIDGKRVIEVLENRLKETLIAYLSALPSSVRKSIRYVSIDMWEGYYQAVVEALPKRVKIVIDRFHVMKNLTGALTKCRREIQRGMSKEERDELKGLRWILVKNEDNLDKDEKAKLNAMYKKCPELKRCHRLKEDFRDIFEEEKSRTKAKARLQAWKKRARKSGLKSLEGFLSTLENWEEWILNYFSSGKITNGVVEGINNKLKLIKRRGYGYRNNGNFRQRVLVECGD